MEGSEVVSITEPPDDGPALVRPPASVEAERLVLAACLHPQFCAEATDIAASIVQPRHFFRGDHRRIYSAILDLHRRGDSTDFATVANALEATADLGSVGGRAGLVELADLVFTAANVASHCRIVLDRAIKRDILQISHKISEQCRNGSGDAADILARAVSDLGAADQGLPQSQIKSVGDVALSTISIFDSYKNGANELYIKTPITKLNDMLGGGLREKHYNVIAARPSMGKTSLAHNIAAYAAASGIPVGIFSLEMSDTEIVERLACSMARIDSSLLRLSRLSNDQFMQATEAVGTVSTWPVYIDDSPSLNDSQLRARSKTMAEKYGVKLIIVDYLQLMQSTTKAENRQQEVTQLSRACMAIPKETNTSLLVLSQLSRETEKRHKSRPGLADLRESGSIEQDANTVTFIYYEHKYNDAADPHISELLLEKQRNGPTGPIKVAWFKEFTRFDNLYEGTQ